MNLRSRNFLVVVSLVLLLCVGGVGMAIASPDGDDDPTYNASGTNGFGTQYSLIEDVRDTYGRPIVAVDPRDGSSVTATLTRSYGRGDRGGPQFRYLALTRFDSTGAKTSFGVKFSDDLPWFGTDNYYNVQDILDVRVQSDGTIRVLVRATYTEGKGSRFNGELWDLHFSAAGEFLGDESQNFASPQGCEGTPDDLKLEFKPNPYGTQVDAARVASDNSISALWDCDYVSFQANREKQTRGFESYTDVWVSHYPVNAEAEDTSTQVDEQTDALYGSDLEFGSGDNPYVLLARESEDTETPTETGGTTTGGATTTELTIPASRPSTRGGILGDQSVVYRFAAGSLDRLAPEDGSAEIDGGPVDLAVDSKGRPVVWTAPDDGRDRGGDFETTWTISRLQSDLLALDTSWGDGGTATVSGEGLFEPYSGEAGNKVDYLTIRPGDKVLALGGPGQALFAASSPRGTDTTTPEETLAEGAIIAGFTANGQVDTGFADNGFKSISYPGPNGVYEYGDFDAVGEPRLQADGKILIPHTTYFEENQPGRQQRIAAPPSQEGSYLGVTRLGVTGTPIRPGTSNTPAGPAASRPAGTRPVTPSSTASRCGRRAISLVRADVRGNKIRLTGLVGSKLYGKKVTIETDPTAVKASAYSRTTTVKASKTGDFTATVPAPKKSQFKTVRYRAKSGRAVSPVLKLPQSLTSRSVKSAKGTITVKGQVKRSVLGKRNKVTIRRLVCGRYRTVAVVKPAADGSYSATFKASKIRGVSFYRAEVVVQVRPGSKKYAIQYARAIAIRTTAQTG